MFDYKQTAKDIKATLKEAGAWFEYDATKWTAIPTGMGLTYQCEMPSCVDDHKMAATYVHIATPIAGHRYPAAICAKCAEYMGLTKPFAWTPIIDAKWLNQLYCEHEQYSLMREGSYYGTKPVGPYCSHNPMPGNQRHPAQYQRDSGKIDGLLNEPFVRGPRVLCDQHRQLYVHTLSSVPTMWPTEVSEAMSKMDALMAALK